MIYERSSYYYSDDMRDKFNVETVALIQGV